MAKKSNDNGWWKTPLFIAGGAILLYYAVVVKKITRHSYLTILRTRIDRVVARLNDQFGQGWVNWSVDMLSSYLKTMLPSQVVALVSVIYGVELSARRIPMKTFQKRRAAADWARRSGLV